MKLWVRACAPLTFTHDPSEEAFDALLATHAFVAVDFYATWCQPCKAYSPKFARLDREVRRRVSEDQVAFAAVDVDLNHALARRFGVKSVPTTVILTRKKGWFGRERVAEALRFSGDRGWNELLRDVLATVTKG